MAEPHRIYVIQLARRAGARHDPRFAWLYVGQSTKYPSDRFKQHMEGGMMASRWVRDHGLWLRPDLYEDVEPIASLEQALEMERDRAIELSKTGYVTLSDGIGYEEPKERWIQWGQRRIEPIIDWVDQAVFSVVARVARPVGPGICLRILQGEESESVMDVIQAPIEEFGRFVHVKSFVLEQRIDDLVSGRFLTLRGGVLGFPRELASGEQ